MKKEILTGLMAAYLFGCSGLPATSPPEVSKHKYRYLTINIEGTLEYAQRTVQALDLIYYRDPENWAVVRNNINTIRLNFPSGIYVDTGVLDTDDNTTTSTHYQLLPWVAGEIVHDAWHREYFRRGEVYEGREGEKKCMERQNEFFQRIGYPQINIEDMLKTRYWEVQPRTW